MVKEKDSNFFKVPKRLLRDEQFKSVAPNTKVIIFYLLSLHNTFSGGEFYQKINHLSQESGISRSTLWRMRNVLEQIGISIEMKDKCCYFYVKDFYEKFIDKKEVVHGETSSGSW